MSIEAKQATPHALLINELLDSRVPKTEREHAAAREIENLRAALLITPQREWVDLTDEEIDYWIGSNSAKKALCRAIESALKEKNT